MTPSATHIRTGNHIISIKIFSDFRLRLSGIGKPFTLGLTSPNDKQGENFKGFTSYCLTLNYSSLVCLSNTMLPPRILGGKTN